MMLRASLSAASAFLIVGTTGCTLKTTPATSGGGTSSGSQTVLEQCTAIATEFCTQAINRCGLVGFTLNDCVSNDVPMCCAGTVCNQTSLSPVSTIDTCLGAIDVVDCNFIQNSTLPAECQGLPKTQ